LPRNALTALKGGIVTRKMPTYKAAFRPTTYRIFRQQKSLNLPFSIEATSEAFCAFNETGKTTMPWGHFVKWKESERLLLLYHSDILFNLVPKRLFQSGAELAEFRGFLGGVRRVS